MPISINSNGVVFNTKFRYIPDNRKKNYYPKKPSRAVNYTAVVKIDHEVTSTTSYVPQGDATARLTVPGNSQNRSLNLPERSEHAPKNQQGEERSHSSVPENQVLIQHEEQRRHIPIPETNVCIRHEEEYHFSSVPENQGHIQHEEQCHHVPISENNVRIRHEEEYYFSSVPENQGYIQQENEYRHLPVPEMAQSACRSGMEFMRPPPVYIPVRVSYDGYYLPPPGMPQEMHHNTMQYPNNMVGRAVNRQQNPINMAGRAVNRHQNHNFLTLPIVYAPCFFPINIDQLASSLYILPDQNARPNTNMYNCGPYNVTDN